MWKHSRTRLRSSSQRLAGCCFTSTETVGLLGTGAQDGHLDFHTAPELCCQRLVECCFTSTEIVGLLGTGAQDGHLDFHTALQPTVKVEVLLYVHRNLRLIRDGCPGRPPGLSDSSWALQPTVKVEVLLYVHRNRRFISDGSPGRPPRLSHSSWALQPTEGEQHLHSVGDLTMTTLYSVLHNNETQTLKGGESERRQLIQELGLFRCRKGRHFASHARTHT